MLRITAIAIMLCAAAPAFAQARSHGPCSYDAQQFCRGVQPGAGRLAACLSQWYAKLSPACRQKLDVNARR